MRYLPFLFLMSVACTEPPDEVSDETPETPVTPPVGMEPEPEPEPCDPSEVAREALAVQSTPAVGDFTVSTEDGVTTATLDASLGGREAAASSSALYLDLKKGELVSLSDEEALTNPSWTLALKRTEIRLNSSDSGPGLHYVARVEDAGWEDAAPPAAGGSDWRTDDFVSPTCEVNELGPGLLDTAIGQWYDYDPMTHAVSAPGGVVFFIYNAGTHAILKFQIQSYDGGVYALRWSPVGGPPR